MFTEGHILLHPFSPTVFYSSAVRNPFLRNLEIRSERQLAFSGEAAGDHQHQLDVGVKGRNFWVTRGDLLRAREWFGLGYTSALKTPDKTLVFGIGRASWWVRVCQYVLTTVGDGSLK